MSTNTKQFIYVLRLRPEWQDEETWTDREVGIVQAHFNKLKEALEDGTLVLAGRTLNDGDQRFGIVILQAESEEEARDFMLSDPAVKEQLMTAELFPYQVALLAKS